CPGDLETPRLVAAPPATTTPSLPLLTCAAAPEIASRPEVHIRETVPAEIPSGHPADARAIRPTSPACSPATVLTPSTRSSTTSGVRPRSTRALRSPPTSSWDPTSARVPPPRATRPRGVRTASKMYAPLTGTPPQGRGSSSSGQYRSPTSWGGQSARHGTAAAATPRNRRGDRARPPGHILWACPPAEPSTPSLRVRPPPG